MKYTSIPADVNQSIVVRRLLPTLYIGGLVTSTLLTLVVLPAVYSWFMSGAPPEEG